MLARVRMAALSGGHSLRAAALGPSTTGQQQIAKKQMLARVCSKGGHPLRAAALGRSTTGKSKCYARARTFPGWSLSESSCSRTLDHRKKQIPKSKCSRTYVSRGGHSLRAAALGPSINHLLEFSRLVFHPRLGSAQVLCGGRALVQ